MEIVCPATKALGSTGHYLLVYLVHLQDKVHMADLQVSNLKLTEQSTPAPQKQPCKLAHNYSPPPADDSLPPLHIHWQCVRLSSCNNSLAPFIPRISRCIFRFQINYNFNFTNYAFLSELLFNVLTSGKKAFSREKAINICNGHIFFWSSALLFTPSSFTFCCTEAWHLFIVKSSIFKAHVGCYFLTIKSRSNTLSGF